MDKKKADAGSFIFFLKGKDQRLDWIILAVSCLLGYIILRICYPYPATISDSGTYVNTAMTDIFSFYRPFGYSAFLQFVHVFSSSVHAVFIVQMILYFFASSAFAFVIKYIYPPVNKIFWYILLFFFVFSPIAFYMANAIMSDLLFAVMVYFMLASYLYLFKKNSWLALGIFLLSLYFALQIRYSAMIFPLLFIVCFFMLKDKLRWVGIAGTVAVSLLFYNQVKSDMQKTTGFDQFSTGFDGWQLANNALHIIPHIDLQLENIRNPEIKSVHSFALAQKDRIAEITQNGAVPSASFMWINDQPLKQYLFAYMQHTGEPYASSWIKLGSGTYKRYGQYLMKKYPLEFMRYYYLPNAKSIFYVNSKEIIGKYTPINVKDISEWYRIPESTDMNAKHTPYESFVAEASAASYIPIWIIIAIGTVLSIVMRKKLLWQSREGQPAFWVIVAAGALYYAATVFASPVSLRFWIPMNAVLFAVIYILYNRILASRKETEA